MRQIFDKMNPQKIIRFTALILFVVFSANSQITQNGGDSVVARGNGVLVKKSQLDEDIGAMQRAAVINHAEISPEKLKALKIQTLKRMIQVQIVLNMATEADKAAGKAEAEQAIAALIAKAGSQDEFERRLKGVGMTPESLKSKITRELTANITLTRSLGVTVSDAEARQFYDQHSEVFSSNSGGPSGYMNVEAKIKKYLTQQKTDKLGPAYLDKLCNAANVQILDPDLK
jgi:hypothetical protein